MSTSSERGELIVVKLGGSLLTDKGGVAAARPKVIARVAGEVRRGRAAGGCRLLLGHGSGSFGHVTASRYGLGREPAGAGPPSVEGVSRTQRQAAELHRRILEALLEAGEKPFSLAPSSFLVTAAGRPARVAAEALRRALELGLLPVVFGDVVMDRRWGATIASTETVLIALIRRLRRDGYRIRRALWLGDTPGVFGPGGEVVPQIDAASFRRLRRVVQGPAGTDVTGGMLHRLEAARTLSRLGIESWIADGRSEGLLEAALRGAAVPATRFVAGG